MKNYRDNVYYSPKSLLSTTQKVANPENLQIVASKFQIIFSNSCEFGKNLQEKQ